jgi:hypothetical protein
LMCGWSCDWRVVYGAIRMAAAGLFLHPDLKQVDGIREFISKRGYALGRLDAVENGVFEDWGVTEHPGGSCFSIGRTST